MHWKKYKESIYSVSTDGKLRNDIRNTIKKPSLDRDGYLFYCMSFNGKKQNKRAHRLVAECFLKSFSEKKQVNHKDFNRTNNNIDNLEMLTLEENIKYSAKKGRYIKNGELNNNAKVCSQTISEIRKHFNTNKTDREIGLIFDLPRKYINDVKLGKIIKNG